MIFPPQKVDVSRESLLLLRIFGRQVADGLSLLDAKSQPIFQSELNPCDVELHADVEGESAQCRVEFGFIFETVEHKKVLRFCRRRGYFLHRGAKGQPFYGELRTCERKDQRF